MSKPFGARVKLTSTVLIAIMTGTPASAIAISNRRSHIIKPPSDLPLIRVARVTRFYADVFAFRVHAWRRTTPRFWNHIQSMALDDFSLADGLFAVAQRELDDA